MMPRMIIDSQSQKKLDSDLYDFACKGLRTLVMGFKSLETSVWTHWQDRYEKINVSNDKEKESKLQLLYDELEYDFNYIGSSAIEDLLQDEVPETIQLLMQADIKMWVLTGDKQETAIEIGKSCNLISEASMELIILSSKTKDELIGKLKYFFNAKAKYDQ